MNQLSVTIYPSDTPSNEKEQRLRDVLECLLRSKKAEREKRVMGEKVQIADAT